MSNARTSNIVRVADNAFDRLQASNGLSITNGSQFANISGLAPLNAEEKDMETQTAKLDKRIAALTQIESALVQVNANLASLYMSDRHEQKKKLRAALRLLEAYDKVPVGAGAPIRRAKNEIISMREAAHTLSASALKKREFSVLACTESLAEVTALLAKAKSKKENISAGPQLTLHDVNPESMQRVLKDTKDHKLPKMSKSGYALGRAPVIPQITVSADKLNKAGFKADSSSGYTVIHNQIVLGVSKTFLDEHEQGRKKMTPLQAAEMLCKFLSKQMKVKLTLVANRSAIGTSGSGALWFWVMKEGDWNAFAKATSGKIGDLKYGFAF